MVKDRNSSHNQPGDRGTGRAGHERRLFPLRLFFPVGWATGCVRGFTCHSGSEKGRLSDAGWREAGSDETILRNTRMYLGALLFFLWNRVRYVRIQLLKYMYLYTRIYYKSEYNLYDLIIENKWNIAIISTLEPSWTTMQLVFSEIPIRWLRRLWPQTPADSQPPLITAALPWTVKGRTFHGFTRGVSKESREYVWTDNKDEGLCFQKPLLMDRKP